MQRAERWFTPVRQHLEAHGFRKRRWPRFEYPVKPDWRGFLSFTLIQEDLEAGPVIVTPTVGLWCDPIERLVAEITERRYDPNGDPTLSTALGFLMPGSGYRSWQFDERRDNPALAEEMVGAIVQYALPYYQAASTFSSVIDDWTAKYQQENVLSFALPVAYWLAGNPAAGEAVLDEAVLSLGQRQHGGAQTIRQFARRFRERITRATA